MGNRLQQVINGDTTAYTYDAANRLTRINGLSLSYDNNGNRLSSEAQTHTWDAANRLTQVSGAQATVNTVYDGLGNRVSQTAEGVTTNYALDTAIGLAEVIFTSAGHSYLHLPGVLMTESAGGATRYLLADGLGSIRHVTDEAGAVVGSQEFDPYGNPLAEPETAYGFTGEWWSADVGLLHLRARWYDPASGTFLSWDAVESEPPYQYVRGNVVNLVDPSGNAPNCEDGCQPKVEGFWEGKARISCFDLKPYGGIENPDAMAEYLKQESEHQLLTRLAIMESYMTTSTDTPQSLLSDRRLIMWTVRARKAGAIAKGGNRGDPTIESFVADEAFHLSAYDTIQAIKYISQTPHDLAENGPAHFACGGHLNAGIYPCDVGGTPDEPLSESTALREWVRTYLLAPYIVYSPVTTLKDRLPDELIEEETTYPYKGFVGETPTRGIIESFNSRNEGRQFFPPDGNHYENGYYDDDIAILGWPE